VHPYPHGCPNRGWHQQERVLEHPPHPSRSPRADLHEEVLGVLVLGQLALALARALALELALELAQELVLGLVLALGLALILAVFWLPKLQQMELLVVVLLLRGRSLLEGIYLLEVQSCLLVAQCRLLAVRCLHLLAVRCHQTTVFG